MISKTKHPIINSQGISVVIFTILMTCNYVIDIEFLARSKIDDILRITHYINTSNQSNYNIVQKDLKFIIHPMTSAHSTTNTSTNHASSELNDSDNLILRLYASLLNNHVIQVSNIELTFTNNLIEWCKAT